MPVIKREKSMVTMAGVTIPLSIAMFFTCGQSSSAWYDSLRLNGSAYQVPAGFKLVIVAARFFAISGASFGNTLGTADAAATNQSGAPSGYSIIETSGTSSVTAFTAASAGGLAESPCYFEIPAGKYPIGRSSNIGNATWLGYLVAV